MLQLFLNGQEVFCNSVEAVCNCRSSLCHVFNVHCKAVTHTYIKMRFKGTCAPIGTHKSKVNSLGNLACRICRQWTFAGCFPQQSQCDRVPLRVRYITDGDKGAEMGDFSHNWFIPR